MALYTLNDAFEPCSCCHVHYCYVPFGTVTVTVCYLPFHDTAWHVSDDPSLSGTSACTGLRYLCRSGCVKSGGVRCVFCAAAFWATCLALGQVKLVQRGEIPSSYRTVSCTYIHTVCKAMTIEMVAFQSVNGCNVHVMSQNLQISF